MVESIIHRRVQWLGLRQNQLVRGFLDSLVLSFTCKHDNGTYSGWAVGYQIQDERGPKASFTEPNVTALNVAE